MKPLPTLLTCLSVLSCLALSQLSYGQASSRRNLEVIERGPHHKVVRSARTITNLDGTITHATNQFTILGNGLNRQEGGKWIEARPHLVETNQAIFGLGAAHKARFPLFITGEPVHVESRLGDSFESRVIGLAYHDPASGTNVLVAGLKESRGVILSSNRLIYPNCFDDIRASVAYTFDKGSVHQDVVLEERPPMPEEWGLSSNTTFLVVISEILDAPNGKVKAKTLRTGAGTLDDDDVILGSMRLVPGAAFATKNGRSKKETPVAKQYSKIEGRRILFEKVAFKGVAAELNALPPEGAGGPTNSVPKGALHSPGKRQNRFYAAGSLPASGTIAAKDKSAKEMAAVALPKDSFVIDWVLLVEYSYPYLLYGTYLVEGSTYFSELHFGSEVVIKYAPQSSLHVLDNFYWEGGDRAVLTAADDNSRGEYIDAYQSQDGPYEGEYGPALVVPAESLSVAQNNIDVYYASPGIISEPRSVSITALDGFFDKASPQDTATFRVSVDPPGEALTVAYTLSGTAQPESDYVPLSGLATILAGQSYVDITVSPGNAPTIPVSRLVLSLNSGSDYTVNEPIAAQVYIRDSSLPAPPLLMNIDMVPSGDTLALTKVGCAAIGQSAADYWNGVSCPWQADATFPNLTNAGYSETTISCQLSNTPGTWGITTPDLMYHSYLYPWTAPGAVFLRNVPAGYYNLYLYSHDGNYDLSVGTRNYGNRRTRDWPVQTPLVWQEGRQFCAFRDFQVQAGEVVAIKLSPGIDGYAILGGLQLASLSSPVVVSGPANQEVVQGGTATFTVAAYGKPPLSYQWRKNGSPLSQSGLITGVNTTTLNVSACSQSDEGMYTVEVISPSGSVISSGAQLHVSQPPTGLVSWWQADDDADDTMGVNHGYIVGPLTFLGPSFCLWSYMESGVRVPASGSLNVGSDLSFALEARFYVYDFTIDHPLMSWAGDSAGGVSLRVRAAGIVDVNFIRKDGGVLVNNVLSSPNPLGSGWHHIVVTFDAAAGRKRLFIDGVKVRDIAIVAGSAEASNPPLTTGDLYLGYSAFKFTPAPPFTPEFTYASGVLDEVSVYNRALSEDEVLSIANCGDWGKCPVAPSIISQPVSQTVTEGNEALFEVSASGSSLTYQWSSGAIPLNDAYGRQLHIPNVEMANAGAYFAHVTGKDWYEKLTTIVSIPAFLTVLPAVAVPIPNGIVGWWRAEDNLENAINAANAAELLNPSAFLGYDGGKCGHAFQFLDGTAGLRLPITTPLSSFTFEAWVLPQEAADARPIWEQRNPNNGQRLTLSMSATRPGSIELTYVNSSGTYVLASSLGAMRSGVFQHVVVTYEAPGPLKIFVNGQLAASSTATLPFGLGAYDLYLGFAESRALANPGFMGKMDEVALYNRALTSAEIASVYGASRAGKIPPCKAAPANQVCWWQAEINETDVYANNPAVLQGDATIAPGLAGQAFKLNGAGGVRVSRSQTIDVGLNNEFTLEGWVKPADSASAQPVFEWNFGFLAGVSVWISPSGTPGLVYVNANIRDTGLWDYPIYSDVLIDTTVFHHIALTFSKTDTTALARLFVDGIPSENYSLIPPPEPLTKGDLFFGYSPSEGQNGKPVYSTGLIDEVGLYTRALQENEVSGIYAAGAGGKCEVAPTILSAPLPQYTYAGNTVQFKVKASGSSLQYTWFFNNGSGPQPITGATGPTLVLTSVTTARSGYYSVRVANSKLGVSLTTTPVYLTVNPVQSGTPPVITTQPVSQSACVGGTASIGVTATGAIAYQWRKNGVSMNGANAQTLTLANVSAADSATYSVAVYGAQGHTISQGATLTVHPLPTALVSGDAEINPGSRGTPIMAVLTGTGPWNITWSDGEVQTAEKTPFARLVSPLAGTVTYSITSLVDMGTGCSARSTDLIGSATVTVSGQYLGWPKRAFRQFLTGSHTDFTFAADQTWIVDGSEGPVHLYGKTTIEGGAVVKFAQNENARIIIHSSLIVCDTAAYRPAIFTALDDDDYGYYYGHWMEPDGRYGQGVSLAFAATSPVTLKNLRFLDLGCGLSVDGDIDLAVFNSQFVNCERAVSLTHADATISAYNCLFSEDSAVLELTAPARVHPQGAFQQVTVHNCQNFILGSWSSGTWSAANSLLVKVLTPGSIPSAFSGITHVKILTSDTGVFQTGGSDGSYYLASNSSYRGAGTTAINATLLTELRSKTTTPPLNLPAEFNTSGAMTFSAQVPRYAAGAAPDLGYHYDALDYTISAMTLTPGADVRVLPGTAIGFRFDWSVGFDIRAGASFTSVGTPDKPITYAPVSAVQEGPFPSFIPAYYRSPGYLIMFLGDYWPNQADDPPPTMNFRFSNFCLNSGISHHFLAGLPELFLEKIDIGWTVCSAVYLQIRDCQLHSGWMSFGEPDRHRIHPAPYGPVIPGAISLFNNAFNRVGINLDPDLGPVYWGGPYDEVTMDIQLTATNNLFRGGWLFLEQVPATEGNWVFRNNVFDKTVFAQENQRGLHYDYNAYWPCVLEELEAGQTATLSAPMVNGAPDGDPDGLHDFPLTEPPVYRNGPLGGFYMQPGSALQDATGVQASELGLWHYTTRENQDKDGSFGTGLLDVGFHYVAVNSTGKPIDTDNDGIPDYVEDADGDNDPNDVSAGTETSPTAAQTVSGTLDSLNTIYDDIDLDGDGMVGYLEEIVGGDPASGDNPLALSLAALDPSTTLFSVTLPPSLDHSVWALRVLVDGEDSAGGLSYVQEQPAVYIVRLTKHFFRPGPHMLQVRLVQKLNVPNDPDPRPAAFLVGPGTLWVNDALFSLDPLANFFGDRLRFRAHLSTDTLSYEIALSDSENTTIATALSSTMGTGIDEEFDLSGVVDGEPYSDDELYVEISASPPPPRNPYKVRLRYLRAKAYPSPDAMEVAYSWEPGVYDEANREAMYQKGVVDVLYNPARDNHYQNTPLNAFNAYVFGMYSGEDKGVLKEALRDKGVSNLFFSGHGSDETFGASANPGDQLPVFNIDEVGAMLHNSLENGTWKERRTPFRLVVLDACNTALSDRWAIAFGIPPSFTTFAAFEESGLAPCAFLGWQGSPYLPSQGIGYPNNFVKYQVSLAIFNSAWLDGKTLAECIRAASNKKLSYPMGYKDKLGWKIYGLPTLTRTGHSGS